MKNEPDLLFNVFSLFYYLQPIKKGLENNIYLKWEKGVCDMNKQTKIYEFQKHHFCSMVCLFNNFFFLLGVWFALFVQLF